MKKLIAIWILGLILVSCSPPNQSENNINQNITPYYISVNNTVSRFIDKESGVVCWVYAAGYGGGISCLPISETKLGDK